MTAGERVVVVGGGVSGLATAALLARTGRRVTLVESGPEVGGRAGRLEDGGFRFDTGPSWYLMPEVFEHFFALLGTSAADELDLVRLDPAYRVFCEGRPPVDVRSGRAEARALFESLEPGSGERLDRYLDSAARTYRLALRRFLYTNFTSYAALVRPDVLRRAGELVARLAQPLDRFVARRFHDRALRQILGYPAVFLGGSPSLVPSMYHLMSHLDLDDGVLYPRGGFVTLVDALRRLAEAHGVEIRTRTRATRIHTRPGGRRPRVTGVGIRDDEGRERTLDADVVVGAADLAGLEAALLPRELRTHSEAYWERRTPGPGALLVLLGVRGRLPALAHHSLLFTADWDAGFDAIFGERPHVPDPASLYVCKPSASDPGVAPDGHENLFVLVPVPADRTLGPGGGPVAEAAADRVVAQIARWTGVDDLADRVVVRHTRTPEDFERDLGAWRGTALGPAHTLGQSAFFRTRNVSRRVEGLYFAGSSTLPGIGLPMCLISAELVVKHLRGDTGTAPLTEPLQPICVPR